MSAVVVWQYVGVLRSARNHINNPKKTKAWGYIACFFVFAGMLSTYNVFKDELVPPFIESFNLAFKNDPYLPDYKVEISKDGKELMISGGMKKGIVKEVKKAITLAPSISIMNLNSIGGRLGPAIELYNIVKEYKMDTVTNNNCLSACVIVFSAGKNRWIGVSGKIGLHSFRGLGGVESNEGPEDQMYQIISKDNNVPISFFEKGKKYSYSEMWYPTVEELISNNFITSEVSLASSSLKNLEIELNKSYKTLSESLPIKLDEITDLIEIKIELNIVKLIHDLNLDQSGVQLLLNNKKLRNNFKKEIISNFCKQESAVYWLKKGTVYEVIYYSKNNKSFKYSFAVNKC
tara:strand:+ start:552 stop:1592 length:1041 start_codon:yes stop_codon:yes gene_type:complete